MAKPTYVAGDVPTEDEVNDWFVNVTAAYKTATESVTSSTTLQDDNDLTVAVEANAVYVVDLLLVHDGLTAGDLKWRFTGPASATYDGCNTGLTQTAASNTDDHTTYTAISQDNVQGTTGAGNTFAVKSSGLLRVAGTAGNLKVEWAQGTSAGTATRVFAGSFLSLRRIS